MTEHISFGIVGPGMIGKVHAEAIQAIPNARLVAVCGRNATKTNEFAARYGATAYTDYEQFLAHPGLQVVNLCTPSGNHASEGVAAARAALHTRRGVLDVDRMTRPGEVRPAARRQAFVDATASSAAAAASREPPTFDDEDESRLPQHGDPADRLHTLALARLEERRLHLPSIESENLCQNPSALPHPLSSELCSGTRWMTPHGAAVDGVAL